MICGLEVNYVKLDLAVPFVVYRSDETKAEKELKQQLQNLHQENRDLKRENELLKEILKR